MPLFEYRCHACAHLEEVLQKHTDPAPDACPACGQAGSMVKAISLTSFQLKGGGWYKDLYSSSSGPAKPDSGTSASDPKQAASTATTPASGAATSAPAAPATGKPAEAKPSPAPTTTTSTASA